MKDQAIIALLSHVSNQLVTVESKQDFILNLISEKYDLDLDELYGNIEKLISENQIQNVTSLEDIFDKIEDVNDYKRDIEFPGDEDNSKSNG